MECNQCFPSQSFVMLTVDRFVGHGKEFLTRGGCEDEYNKYLYLCCKHWCIECCLQLKS